jgi:50S ribosomal protein L16 3-hydroxylase
MPIQHPLTLLGGISPAEFMQRYWQRKPLLVRQAIPDFKPLVDRASLFAMAADSEVESRLVIKPFKVQHGPFARNKLPKLSQNDWTLLVQGVDLHDDKVADLMHQFRFVPDARLDDVMISFATDGGGVGPHFDSYDVFLLQAYGQRKWRIGKQKDLSLIEGVDLKVLANFKPSYEYVLNPGDMLYLPPRYAHDGIAVGECMTYSIGFRAPAQNDLAREMLMRLSDETENLNASLYQDTHQEAVERAGMIPKSLQSFAQVALDKALGDPQALARVLGEHLTEPKANIWFSESQISKLPKQVRLDRRSRMMYDDKHIFLNGESWRASGPDARLMQLLADQRALTNAQLQSASHGAKDLLLAWCKAGWLKVG